MSNNANPRQSGFHAMRRNWSRRDHKIPSAKIGTRKPCEYCGSFDQRSIRWLSVCQWLTIRTTASTAAAANAELRDHADCLSAESAAARPIVESWDAMIGILQAQRVGVDVPCPSANLTPSGSLSIHARDSWS